MEIEDQLEETGEELTSDTGEEGGGADKGQPASTGQFTEEEAKAKIAEYNKNYEAYLENGGWKRPQEEEPPEQTKTKGEGAPSYDEWHDDFMENTWAKAAAKYPVREGMSDTQARQAYAKQQKFVQREHTKVSGGMILQEAIRQVKEEFEPKLAGLTKIITDASAHSYFGTRPELTGVEELYRDILEGRVKPTLEHLETIRTSGVKHGTSQRAQERPEFTVITGRRGTQTTVPTDLAPILKADDKSQQKIIDKMLDEFLPMPAKNRR